MKILSCDVESFSEIKLRDAGLHRYMDHPSFEVMLLAYSYDYEPATIIDLKAGEVLPPQLLHDLTDDKVIKCAWNAAFERNALERLTGLYMPPEQWRDTMILAASCGLPLSLDGASKALSLPEDKAKMAEGKKLIQYFCVPCKPTKKEPNRTRHLPEEAPERWEIFKTYCCRDVDAEMYIHQMLSDFEQDATEHRAWCQDQRINDLGVRLDMQLVQNAIRFDAINKAALVAEATALTGMENPTSVAQIKVWLQEQEGIEIESLNKKAMPDVLESLQSDVAKHFLVNLRSEFSKSSTAKYKAMERCVCSDNRARGLFQFFGARTARWAGRKIQLQNLPQNHMHDLEDAREIVKASSYDNFTCLYDNPSNVLSELIRTALVPSDGHKFLVADFSSIEGVVLAWLAGEQWVLDEYAGEKLLYEACASEMFGVPKESVKKGGEHADLRQKGKCATLACGYQGAVGALKAFGADKLGMSEEDMQETVTKWRAANPKIVRLWYGLDAAAIRCVKTKAPQLEPQSDTRFTYESGILRMWLPSGRSICYYNAEIGKNKFGRACVTYMGIDQFKKKWMRIETSGGKLAENLTQAVARDCLRDSMLNLEDEGFQVVMHCHDEVICEEPITGRHVDEMVEIMTRPIPWATGLHLRAEGFETLFYKKD